MSSEKSYARKLDEEIDMNGPNCADEKATALTLSQKKILANQTLKMLLVTRFYGFPIELYKDDEVPKGYICCECQYPKNMEDASVRSLIQQFTRKNRPAPSLIRAIAHLKQHHAKDPQVLEDLKVIMVCPIDAKCHSQVGFYDDVLKKHIEEKHPNASKPQNLLECPCGSKFKSFRGYDIHSETCGEMMKFVYGVLNRKESDRCMTFFAL